MKILGTIAAVAFSIVISFAQTSAPHYHQIAKYNLGGDGFWDLLTFDPGTNRVFIAHNDSVVAVNAATGKQDGSIPASGAHGVAVIPHQHLGFVTNGKTGSVTVFDTETMKVKSEIKVGEKPDAIIYDEHSNRVIVLNAGSKNLMAIDPASQKVAATVALPGKPELAASDAGHVYVNLEDIGEIVSIGATSWKADQRWKLTGCEEPTGLAIDESRERLFAACGNKQMVVVDAKSGKVLGSVPTGSSTDGAAFDPGSKLAFAPNGEGTLTVIGLDASGKYNVVENVSTQRGARTIALDTKSHQVFLPTAELGPPAEGQRRPTIKPGTFMLLVYGPGK